MGISRRPREGEINDISETRDAIALTVLRCASAGARDVQALKVSTQMPLRQGRASTCTPAHITPPRPRLTEP